MDKKSVFEQNDDYFKDISFDDLININFDEVLEVFKMFFLVKSKLLFEEIKEKPNTRIDFMLANLNILNNAFDALINLYYKEDNKEVGEEMMKAVNIQKNKLKEVLKHYNFLNK